MNCFKVTTCNLDNGLSATQRALVGNLAGIEKGDQALYKEAAEAYHAEKTTELFEPIIPKVLSTAQPFCAWKVMIDMNRRWKLFKKKKIYLVQLGWMPKFILGFRDDSGNDFFHFLASFLASYFPGVQISVLPPILDVFEHWDVKLRVHPLTNEQQYLVTEINSHLSQILPSDAMAILGISWTDLYPSEDLNFVLGEASFADNAAAFCFGRFEPKIYKNGGTCKDIEELDGDIIYRLIRTISHETCHLFGMHHCVHFQCAMNGSDSMELALSQPLVCCPVCTRKMQAVCGFSLHQYYTRLRSACSEIQDQFPSQYMPKNLQWLDEVLKWIEKVEIR